ncbi:OsmC family peroxiredoxin [Rhodobacterales bacterium HKCCE3408]|nr:OsmC family peroxiredoxin [Rhodobacterales bacterium HKCCE3408]
MAIEKSGSAIWSGTLQKGTGKVSTQSGSLDAVDYTFAKRFEGQSGTNPEELIGAAHASCFAMALSMILGQNDMTADEINATSTVTLDTSGDAPTVTKIHLDVTASIPGADLAKFDEAAKAAKAGCPISRLLAAAEITMDAKLA